jgi:hypothetical protein
MKIPYAFCDEISSIFAESPISLSQCEQRKTVIFIPMHNAALMCSEPHRGSQSSITKCIFTLRRSASTGQLFRRMRCTSSCPQLTLTIASLVFHSHS